ncbi:MAG: Fic-DOC domain mobile mystery protein B [Candidatus Omnitrophota bacterium]|jgi:Fic-DOC domain mobile mystery protein B
MKGLNDDSHATPLDLNELKGLVPTHITNRGELNRLENDNILEAEAWAANTRNERIIDQGFVMKLHKHMYDQVWRWAGTFRRTDKNIGVAWQQVPQDLAHLMADVRGWVEHSSYGANEICIRLHHKLVWIHPFPNGNGRHARLMADLVAQKQFHIERFSWGAQSAKKPDSMRKEYIRSLQSADAGDYEPLLVFARS